MIGKLEDLTTLGIKQAIIELTFSAYMEGRAHEYEQCFPDVGMGFDKTFDDTDCFKLMNKMEIL